MSDAISLYTPPADPHAEEMHRDDVASKMGFWLFLFTEFFLFAAMFIMYAVYRTRYLDDFHDAAAALNTGIGTINTIILLFSSLTVVLSIVALQKGKKHMTILYLAITIACGGAFLVIKTFEWKEKFSHGIFLQTAEKIAEGQGAELLQPGADMLPMGQVQFYSLYFVMTGTHAIHIIIGMSLLLLVLILVARDRITADRFVLLENIGLYWHIVDLIWIYLFPLFYLIT